MGSNDMFEYRTNDVSEHLEPSREERVLSIINTYIHKYAYMKQDEDEETF